MNLLARWTDDEVAAMAARIKRFGWPYNENAEAIVRQVIEEQDRLRPNTQGAVDPMRESRIARARGLAQAIAECRDDARLDGIREGAAEIVELLDLPITDHRWAVSPEITDDEFTEALGAYDDVMNNGLFGREDALRAGIVALLKRRGGQ